MQQNGSATVLFQRARDPLFSVLLEDERVQKRCVRVVLLVHIANFKRKRTLTFLRLLPRAPVLFQFFCCPSARPFAVSTPRASPLYGLLLTNGILLFLGERLHRRVRTHSGTDEHVVRLLERKFGLFPAVGTIPSIWMEIEKLISRVGSLSDGRQDCNRFGWTL